ncbi:putative ABC transporter permease [Clostridium faecium]|uniref:ABC transporter permease n=1 Tax=Clostridium faecium TaxID=2762223 RepID=A0ABR8YRK3_9CLOT|nr:MULTISPECIES: hypothetical protein [Clostridium]MBD8046643.1 hypothetical protein [Clostridium faecium]
MEGFSFYYLFSYFIIYSFIGWCLEVLYHLYSSKKFVNRGFLHGPICPIYGSCGALMAWFLTPIVNNPVYLFLGGFILATTIEYITGYLLEKLFGTRWWDYTDDKFNIKGYVCLRFSIYWGIISIFVMRVVHPRIEAFVYSIPLFLSETLYTLILILFVVDFTLTINNLIEFNNILKELNNIADDIRGNLIEMRNELVDNINDIKDNIEDKREEINAKFDFKNANFKRYSEKVMKRLKFKHKSLLKAYPNVKSRKFNDILEYIKSRKNN